MGAVILPLMVLYLLLLVWATRRGWRWAVERGWQGRKRWLGAAYGFLIVYLPVFWDWIPTVVAHRYYCETEAGFWVYKTPELWKKENPGVMETLVANKGAPLTRNGDDTNFTDTYFLNNRINKVVQENRVSVALHIFRHEQEVVDTKSNQVLARYVDFRAGYPGGAVGIAPRSAGLAAMKLWLADANCSDGENNNYGYFLLYKRTFQGTQK